MEKNQWAVVTGATSGIGEQTAKELAAKGYHLQLVGRRAERLEKIKSEILSQFPVQVEIASVDIRDQRQVEAWLKTQNENFKHLTVLVNNAGLAKGADSLQSALEGDILEMIDTNVTALLLITKKLLPFMIKQGRGHIVNLGSVAGRWVYPGGATYCATKHAVKAISEALRLDLKGTGIRVTNIEPGMVNTEFSLVRFGDQKKADQVYADMTPLSAQDIAQTIIWCIDRPGHVNIQELVIYPTDQVAIRDIHRHQPQEKS